MSAGKIVILAALTVASIVAFLFVIVAGVEWISLSHFNPFL